MNTRRRAIFLLASMLFGSTALAAPVTMLQFGSFESRAEAEAKLAEVKTKHSGVIGNYATSIREVKLPPDNLVVYRTQAGPVANRAAAQSVCSQLASNGDECYVVETAIAQPATDAPVKAVASTPAAPAATAVAAAIPSVSVPALPSVPTLPAVASAAPLVANVANSATDVAAKKIAEQNPLPPRAAPVFPVPVGPAAALAPKIPTLAPATTQAIPLVGARSLPPVPALSASPEVAIAAASGEVKPPSIASAAANALPPVLSLPSASALPAKPALSASPEVKTPLSALNDPALAPPSPELQSAIERAVAAQKNATADAFVPPVRPTVSDAAAAKPAPSLLARLNPFRESDAPPATARVVKPADAGAVPIVAAAKPVAPVVEAVAEKPRVIVTPATVTPPVDLAPPTLLAKPELSAPQPKPAILLEAPRVIAEAPAPVRLPPPPPPLLASDRARLPAPITTGVLPTSAVTPVTVAVAAPTSNAAPAQVPGVVKVEEAKRVPLTETVVSAPPAVGTVPSPTAPLLPPPSLALLPSATLGQKTIWAQIGQFTDTQAALAFWDAYRQSHPDFPVVRVRVTSPYQLKQRGDDRVWLRVGPFEREGFITNLCASVPAETLRCGRVSDLGVAASTTRTPGFLPGSRYAR